MLIRVSLHNGCVYVFLSELAQLNSVLAYMGCKCFHISPYTKLHLCFQGIASLCVFVYFKLGSI